MQQAPDAVSGSAGRAQIHAQCQDADRCLGQDDRINPARVKGVVSNGMVAARSNTQTTCAVLSRLPTPTRGSANGRVTDRARIVTWARAITASTPTRSPAPRPIAKYRHARRGRAPRQRRHSTATMAFVDPGWNAPPTSSRVDLVRQGSSNSISNRDGLLGVG